MSSEGNADDRTAREAARWFARLNADSISTNDLLAFRAWRAEPTNADAYQEMEQVWSKSGALAVDHGILAATDAAFKKRRTRSAFTITAGASGAVFALIVAFLWLSPMVLGDSYQTAAGQEKTLTLADGSTVQLDTDSRIIVRMTPWRRSIVLARGRALFDVVHQANRPLEVQAGDASIRDLGTRFQVERAGKGAEVVLLQGEVQVRGSKPGDKAESLHPGEAWSSNVSAAPHPVSITRAVSWTSGTLQFDDRPIAAVIADLNRYGDHKIILSAPQAVGAHVSGRFETTDTAGAAAALAELYDLDLRTVANGDILLTSRASGRTEGPSAPPSP